MTGCVFCQRIAQGEYIETSVVSVVRFVPLNPVTPGHMLFVPRGHAESAAASPWRAGSACMAAAQYVADEGIEANIITSIGGAATQTIRHTHVHVVPRVAGDGLALPWTGQERRSYMDALIERSSLGTPAAKALRESVPVETAREIVRRANETSD